jgi:hypothetical protein
MGQRRIAIQAHWPVIAVLFHESALRDHIPTYGAVRQEERQSAGWAGKGSRTMPEIKIEAIDHVSLPVAVGEEGKDADPLKKSKEFYSGILGLKEVGRPAALAESIKLGAWYQVGERGSTLHLIANEDGKSTFRKDKGDHPG